MAEEARTDCHTLYRVRWDGVAPHAPVKGCFDTPMRWSQGKSPGRGDRHVHAEQQQSAEEAAPEHVGLQPPAQTAAQGKAN